jgi:DNA invertase Pin-like site-specific DNA recombinase
MTKPLKRCALYTRKSSEEGLEQDFNSLDAQREACAAYVTSQAGDGWRAIDILYDDGGYSGGSMERPALKRLLADIAAGKIDIVVVYKIDRLTRALADFARMVELFDHHNVSFVSVTQAFNTTTSMGRLTLNVLLSFAQFEREVTGERIRDKIATSKAKGMWMGGHPPLGYDCPAPGSRTLVVNPSEADTVRSIFATYVELGSVHALQQWLHERDIRPKQRTTLNGKTVGGQTFSRGALFHMLRNRIYLGMITHKGKVHPGMHPAITDLDLFEAVQSRLEANRQRTAPSGRIESRSPLTGRIFDADGAAMSPTFAYGRSKRIYRYYVSAPLQQGERRPSDDQEIRRVAANLIEAKLTEFLRRVTASKRGDPLEVLTRIEVYRDSVQLLMPIGLLAPVQTRLANGEEAEQDMIHASQMRISLPLRMRRRGGRTIILNGAESTAKPNPVLVKALRAAHEMIDYEPTGLPILDQAPTDPYERKLVRLAFLAPDIQQAILTGRQPEGLSLADLLAAPISPSWTEQARQFLGSISPKA